MSDGPPQAPEKPPVEQAQAQPLSPEEAQARQPAVDLSPDGTIESEPEAMAPQTPGQEKPTNPWQEVTLALEGWEYQVPASWLGKDEMSQKHTAEILSDLLKTEASFSLMTTQRDKGTGKPDLTFVWRFTIYGDMKQVASSVGSIVTGFDKAVWDRKVFTGNAYAIVKFTDGSEDLIKAKVEPGADINEALDAVAEAVFQKVTPETMPQAGGGAPDLSSFGFEKVGGAEAAGTPEAGVETPRQHGGWGERRQGVRQPLEEADKTCPQCGGEGYIELRPGEEWARCDRCNGTGAVSDGKEEGFQPGEREARDVDSLPMHIYHPDPVDTNVCATCRYSFRDAPHYPRMKKETTACTCGKSQMKQMRTPTGIQDVCENCGKAPMDGGFHPYPEGKNYCPFCGEQNLTRDQVDEHYNDHVENWPIEDLVRKEEGQVTVAKCPECGDDMPYGYQAHHAAKHPTHEGKNEEPNKCPFCSFTSEDPEVVKNHLYEWHVKKGEENRCAKCGTPIEGQIPYCKKCFNEVQWQREVGDMNADPNLDPKEERVPIGEGGRYHNTDWKRPTQGRGNDAKVNEGKTIFPSEGTGFYVVKCIFCGKEFQDPNPEIAQYLVREHIQNNPAEHPTDEPIPRELEVGVVAKSESEPICEGCLQGGRNHCFDEHCPCGCFYSLPQIEENPEAAEEAMRQADETNDSKYESLSSSDSKDYTMEKCPYCETLLPHYKLDKHVYSVHGRSDYDPKAERGHLYTFSKDQIDKMDAHIMEGCAICSFVYNQLRTEDGENINSVDPNSWSEAHFDYDRLQAPEMEHLNQVMGTGSSGIKNEKRKDWNPNPWAVCTVSVGRDREAAYERCIQHVKDKQKKGEATKEWGCYACGAEFDSQEELLNHIDRSIASAKELDIQMGLKEAETKSDPRADLVELLELATSAFEDFPLTKAECKPFVDELSEEEIEHYLEEMQHIVKKVKKVEEGARENDQTQAQSMIDFLVQAMTTPADTGDIEDAINFLLDTGLISQFQPPNIDETVFEHYLPTIQRLTKIKSEAFYQGPQNKCPFCDYKGGYDYEVDQHVEIVHPSNLELYDKMRIKPLQEDNLYKDEEATPALRGPQEVLALPAPNYTPVIEQLEVMTRSINRRGYPSSEELAMLKKISRDMSLVLQDRATNESQKKSATELKDMADALIDTDMEAASDRIIGVEEGQQRMQRFNQPQETTSTQTPTQPSGTCPTCGGSGAIVTNPKAPWVGKEICSTCGGSGVVQSTA